MKAESVRIAFVLTMPGCSSWDGKWSGRDRLWAVVRLVDATQAEKILAKHSYSYSFGDGWMARVNVRAVDAAESAQIKEKSAGFSGYDWMVDEIENDQRIKGAA